jgi:hypothetical protein
MNYACSDVFKFHILDVHELANVNKNLVYILLWKTFARITNCTSSIFLQGCKSISLCC